MEVSLDSLALKRVLAMKENGTEHLPLELSREEKPLALRKTRAREKRKRKKRRRSGKCGHGKVDHLQQGVFGHMDAAIWGELQSHIDLSMIYVKLPLAPFFRMRQVCKEWNRLASDRQFLEHSFKPPIADPFFVVTTRGGADRLLTCQASSWSSMPLPQVKCEVSGLLVENSYDDSNRDSVLFRIFDLHTRVFHALPPIPTTMMMEAPDDEDDEMYYFLIGMTVDTTLIPYSFRVILANEEIGTRIYDSKSGAWTQKPSTFEYAHLGEIRPSCVNNNQFLYSKVEGGVGLRYFELHTYYLQDDVWTWERPRVPTVPQRDVRGIGLWRERLYVFGKYSEALAIWKIDVDHPLCPEKQWTLFGFMPGHLCAWISSGNDRNLNCTRSTFCNEHVLLYNCAAGEEKAVLYNLDRDTWKKVVLPALSGSHQLAAQE